MPLTDFQKTLAQLLAQNRSADSHLAGGAALHFEPHSIRYSNDLDYFHDTVERVASAFAADQKELIKHGYQMTTEIKQPGYIRCKVSKQEGATKVEWAHDSDWRFLPVVQNDELGFVLLYKNLGVCRSRTGCL